MRPERPWPAPTVYLNSHSAEVPLTLTTDKDGKYSTGALNAGVYTVQVELRNYNANRFFVTVRDGKTSNGDRKLTRVEPGTPTLQGKVSPEEIAKLPINGRDVLNTAQFQPGVLIQDGRSLDATKTGTFAASIHKFSGADTLYTLDGIALTDENKGGTTQNVALSSVDEMLVNRAMLNVSVGPDFGGRSEHEDRVRKRGPSRGSIRTVSRQEHCVCEGSGGAGSAVSAHGLRRQAGRYADPGQGFLLSRCGTRDAGCASCGRISGAVSG